MFKIGEFSRLTQVSVRMLRYYDENGLLLPASIDPATGYRLYTAAQIPEIQKILLLRDAGFGIREIRKTLPLWNSARLTEQLLEKREELLRSMEEVREKIHKIETAVEDLTQNIIELHSNITLKSIPSMQVASLRSILPSYNCEGELWEQLGDFLQREQIRLPAAKRSCTIFYDEEHKENNVDMEVCAEVASLGKDAAGVRFRALKGVPLMACSMVYGSFQNIGGAYQAFARWLTEHSVYQMRGPTRQICHIGPWDTKQEEEFLTELQIPVTKILLDSPTV